MRSLRNLVQFVGPYWKQAVIGPLLMVLEVAMDLMQPRLMQRIVDVGIGQLDMSVVTHTGLLMVGLAFLGALGGSGTTVFAVIASQGFGTDLREELFRKVQSLSFGNLDRLETGQLVTRLTNDVTQVQEVLRISLSMMVRGPLMLIGSLIMAILTSPSLAFLLLVLSPLVMGMLIWVIKRAYPMFTEVQRRLDWLNTVMQENLAGVRVVKAFVRAQFEERRFGRVNDDLMSRTVSAARLLSVVRPSMMLALNLGVVGVIWFGGIQVVRGEMTVGQIIAFVNYLMRTLFSLMMVSMLLMRVSRAAASAERILEVLDNKPEIEDRPGAIGELSSQGRVAFEDVTFSYNGQAHDPVLQDISFAAGPGQTVAVLGATGSGKTSLIHLIPRFYDVSAGRVLIDGIDVRDLSQESLRRNIGIALQESVLFSGTVRDCIRYGRPDATDGEVVAAARAAQAHDFIIRFPDGYETMLGQRGVNLSGGQKQRLAIARALIMKPSVLILDDSTSSVDVETESRIQDALSTFMKECTTFVIAQRISTVLNADKILVLEEGKIVADGTHADLMASSPVYREIYQSQLGNGVETYV